MRAAIFILGLVLGLVASGLPAAAQCMNAGNDDEIAEGRLTSGRFRDAAGRPETAFILRLPVPTCLEGDDEFDDVKEARTIHIFSSDPAIHRSIRRFVGKTVLVRGRPFGAHTAHHHAPIVMDITEIDSH